MEIVINFAVAFLSDSRPSATDLGPVQASDSLQWTGCYILLAMYEPKWKSLSSDSVVIAGAARYPDTDARPRLRFTQNATKFLTLVS